MLIVIMGVAGSGKTTVGRALAQSLGWRFVEGDLYHRPEAIEKMRQGQALTDQDRAEWLTRLHALFNELIGQKKDAVISCSALKRSYRERLCKGIQPSQIVFVFLKVSCELARARMHQRIGHFMPERLIVSQFEALELPSPAEAVELNGERPVSELLNLIRSRFQLGKAAS